MTASAETTLTPPDEAALAALIAAAHTAREPLAIEGRGTKRGLLRPVQAARTVSTRKLTGITLYRPSELIISARAGTPIPDIEAALAEHGQHLIAEPPDTRAIFGATEPATLGGIIAANLSGPRRIAWGAMRDHLLGIRFVNGAGEVLRSGGRVLKNVTGLDLCKLLAGSYGTLGVITEITLKILPAPEATATLLIEVPDIATGVRALSAGLGSPFSVTGAALLPGTPTLAALRLEDFAASVTYRAARLQESLAAFGPATLLEGDPSRSFWRGVRDAAPLAAQPEDAIWRVSVRPSAALAVVQAANALGARSLLDWGGGLVWVAAPATVVVHDALAAAATISGGTCTLFRGPEALRLSVAVLPVEAAPLAAIAQRVKAALDPSGILNPGRMHGGL